MYCNDAIVISVEIYNTHNLCNHVFFTISNIFYRASVLLSVKRICRCCSNRHLGKSLNQNSKSPLNESHPCWMSWPALDKGNLLQPSWPLLGNVKTAGQSCDLHGSWAVFLWYDTSFWPKASFRLTVYRLSLAAPFTQGRKKWQVTGDRWQVTPDMWHMTHDT